MIVYSFADYRFHSYYSQLKAFWASPEYHLSRASASDMRLKAMRNLSSEVA